MRHENALSHALATVAAKPPGPPPDFSGHWINELNSFMDLVIKGGSVSGRYTSKVSSKGGPVSGPVIGYVAGDVIAFSVLWPGATAITSWVGQLIRHKKGHRLDTLWHLIVNVPNAEDPDIIWTTIHAGADIFHR